MPFSATCCSAATAVTAAAAGGRHSARRPITPLSFPSPAFSSSSDFSHLPLFYSFRHSRFRHGSPSYPSFLSALMRRHRLSRLCRRPGGGRPATSPSLPPPVSVESSLSSFHSSSSGCVFSRFLSLSSAASVSLFSSSSSAPPVSVPRPRRKNFFAGRFPSSFFFSSPHYLCLCRSPPCANAAGVAAASAAFSTAAAFAPCRVAATVAPSAAGDAAAAAAFCSPSSGARDKKGREKKKHEQVQRGCCGLSYSQFVRGCAAALSAQQLRKVAALLFCYRHLKCKKASSREAVLRRIKKLFPEAKREEMCENLRDCLDIIEPQQFHRLSSQLAASRLLLPHEDIHETLPQSGVGDFTSAAALQQQPFLSNLEEELEGASQDREEEEEEQKQTAAGKALAGGRVHEKKSRRAKRQEFRAVERRGKEEQAAKAQETGNSGVDSATAAVEGRGAAASFAAEQEGGGAASTERREKTKPQQQKQLSKKSSEKRKAREAPAAVGRGEGGGRGGEQKRAREGRTEEQADEELLPYLFSSHSPATDVAATAYGLLRHVAKRPPQATRYQDKRVGEFLVDLQDPAVPPAGSSSKRLVFVSNIPAGSRRKITQAIKKAFSGCGEIVNIEIFNDRLRTIDERDETSMQRRGSSKASSDKLAGRFSPVFAIAEFATEEGKKKACSTYLRVFGVPCIDRLLYVDDAADRTTLVASNLPFALATHEVARILAFALVSDLPPSASPPCVCRLTMTNPEIYGYNHLIVEARSDRPKPYFVLSPLRQGQQLQQLPRSHGLLDAEAESAAAAAAAAAIEDDEADAAIVNECVQPHVFLSVFGSHPGQQSPSSDVQSIEQQQQQRQDEAQEGRQQHIFQPPAVQREPQQSPKNRQDGTKHSSSRASPLVDIGRSAGVATDAAAIGSAGTGGTAARSLPPFADSDIYAAHASAITTDATAAAFPPNAAAAALATGADAADDGLAAGAASRGVAVASAVVALADGAAAAPDASPDSDLLMSRVSPAGDINEDVFIPTVKVFDASNNPKDVSNVFPVLRQDQDMANLVLKKVLMDRLAIQNDGMFLLRFSSFEAAAVAIRKCRDMVLFDSRALLLFSPRRCVCIDGKMVDMPLR